MSQTPNTDAGLPVSGGNTTTSTNQLQDLSAPAPPVMDGPAVPDHQVTLKGDSTVIDGPLPSIRPDTPSSFHSDAWSAHGEVEALVHGAKMLSPVIANALPVRLTKALGLTNTTAPAHPTEEAPPGFVLTGKIALFGRENLQVDFYSHHGPPPAGETLQPGESPVYQRAELNHELHISEFLPSFKNTTFDSIGLKDLTFTYQNMLVDPRRPIGFTIDTDVTFNQDHGKIYQVLTTFLKSSQLDLHLTCSLGVQDWHKPLSVSSFELEGMFTNFKTQPVLDGMSITSLGARLTGFHSTTYGHDGRLTLGKVYGYSLFGTLTWQPHFLQEVSFEITESAGDLSLSLSLKEEWVHAFGISGLTLNQLHLSTTFDMHNIGSTLEFDLHALMEIGSKKVILDGQFSTSGGFIFEATLEKLGFSGLSDLFDHFYSTTLVKSIDDLEIGSATINFSKDNGLSLQIHDLRINTHTISEVDVAISSKGVVLDVSFGDPIKYTFDSHTIELSEATAIVTFARSVQVASGADGIVAPPSSPGNTSVTIKGRFVWEGHSLNAKLHLYHSSTTNKLEYTVVALFEDLTFARLVSEPKLTCLENCKLPGAMLVAASQADAEFGDLDRVPCQINKGFQVCAVLKGVKPLSHLFGENAEVILCAGWDGKFTIELFFPTPSTPSKTAYPKPNIDFGKGGVIADEIVMKIILGGSTPTLVVTGGLKIPINHQPEPLHFEMSISLYLETATLSGKLTVPGGWKNPFGISDGLVINTLALDIGFIFPSFVPEKIGFKGSFLIETAPVDVQFLLCEEPSNELLSAKTNELDLQKIVSFTNSLTGKHLPIPPNVIRFQQVAICICPLGATFEGVTYPPGFAFSATVVLFGITGSASVSIGKDGFRCSGSVDTFKLGSLQVRGAQGPRACFNISLTEAGHYGSIDGRITIFDVDTMLTANFEMHPKLTFSFSFILHFADIFEFEVKASRTVAGNPDATGAEYNLKAAFTQDIHSHIEDKLEQMFREKILQEKKEASDVKAKLSARQEEWEKKVSEAQKHLTSVLAAKNKKIEEKNAEQKQLIEKHKAAIAQHQTVMNDRQNKLRQGTAEKKLKLSKAGVDGTKKINDAEQKLRGAHQEWDRKLAQGHLKLDGANKQLHEKFGDAQEKMSSAQTKVKSLTDQISKIADHIKSCHNAHWYDLAAKAAIPCLEIEEKCLQAAKVVAEKALEFAKTLAADAEKFASGVVKEASKELDMIQKDTDKALNALQSGLDDAKAELAKLVSSLQNDLDAFTKAEIVVIDGFGKLMAEAQAGLDKATSALNSVVLDLKGCFEFTEVVAAEAALKLVKAGGSALFEIAKAGEAVKMGVEEIATSAWEAILSTLEKVVDITSIEITGELGKAVKGGLAFDAEVDGTVKGHPFHFTIQYDQRAVEAFFKTLFDKLVKLIEDGVMHPAETIVKFEVEHGPPLAVRYGPNGSFSVAHSR